MATKKVSPEPCMFCGVPSGASSREILPCGARHSGECSPEMAARAAGAGPATDVADSDSTAGKNDG